MTAIINNLLNSEMFTAGELEMRLLAVCLMVVLTGCATNKGNDRHAQHAADQIRMVAVQREAMAQEAKAEADSNAKLYDSLARVCETNPDHCPAVTVALAVIGTREADTGSDSAPVVQLQQQKEVGLEYVKALATPVSTVLTGVAIAGIQANVQKNASDNNRDILLGDQAADRGIVEAVAGLGAVAASQTGIEVDGDYMVVSDNGAIDQSTTNTTTTTTTTTTSSETSFALSTELNYAGASMTLADLIKQLQSAGATYSIDLDGDGTPDVSGDGDGETIDITCENVSFSPKPAECI
ncbi:MAG: hypothetical protein L7S57_04595 [Luminiphilus sp.]|nr:hypothetical protein [Luminiphilus sp.]